MNDEVIVICPELVAGAGGVADYTLRVVRQWDECWPVRFLVPDRVALPGDRRVEVVERRASALREKLPTHCGRVFLQYSAYGFDHFGYPRWLLRELADWRDKAGGLLVIMFHEIWTFWPVLNKNYLIQQLHRRDLRTLVSRADALFTSTASQGEHLRELGPRAAIEILPVGSNITPVAGGGNREHGLAMLFGLQGARIRALQALRDDLRLLASAGKLTKLVIIGDGNTREGDRMEEELLSKLPCSKGTLQLREVPEQEISAWFWRASFGVSAQDELSITKSGTFMAYAAHGLNILSPGANAAKFEPLCWLTSPAELLSGLSADELTSRAEKLCAWQERTSSWSIIARRFADALQMPETRRATASTAAS